MKFKNKWYFIIGFVFTIGIPLLMWYYLDIRRLEAVSLGGTIATIIGLIIAIYQISGTKADVNKAINEIGRITLAAELSKADGIIKEIQDCLSNNTDCCALKRLKDLKELLIFNSKLYENQLKNHIFKTTTIINRLDAHMVGKNNMFDKIDVKENLEKTRTDILKIITDLKTETNDTKKI